MGGKRERRLQGPREGRCAAEQPVQPCPTRSRQAQPPNPADDCWGWGLKAYRQVHVTAAQNEPRCTSRAAGWLHAPPAQGRGRHFRTFLSAPPTPEPPVSSSTAASSQQCRGSRKARHAFWMCLRALSCRVGAVHVHAARRSSSRGRQQGGCWEFAVLGLAAAQPCTLAVVLDNSMI